MNSILRTLMHSYILGTNILHFSCKAPLSFGYATEVQKNLTFMNIWNKGVITLTINCLQSKEQLLSEVLIMISEKNSIRLEEQKVKILKQQLLMLNMLYAIAKLPT